MVALYVTCITYMSWPKDNLRPKDSVYLSRSITLYQRAHIFFKPRDMWLGGQLIACPSVYFDGDVPPSLHPFLS